MHIFAPNSSFSYLPGHWCTLTGAEKVKPAVYATALASWARESRQQGLMRLARSYYSKALAQTNKALGDPRLAVYDDILLSVLLLSAFEALAFRGRKSPTNWTAHVQGSATLLNLRGDKQLDSEIGRCLFHQTSMNIRTSCAQRRIPFPPNFSRLQKHAATVLDANSPSFRLGRLIHGFAALRVSMPGMLATAVVHEALYLDGEAIDLFDRMVIRQPYKVITKVESPSEAYTYKGLMHQYQLQNDARLCNVMRMIRLVLNEWIFCSFQHELRGIVVDRPAPEDPLSVEWDRLPTRAGLNAEELIDDTLASVPYSLELLDRGSSASARFLVWPLASIGASELCPTSAKIFVINRLKRFGEHGLEQAKEAAAMLEEGVSMEDW